MAKKLTRGDLEKKVKELEKESLERKRAEKTLRESEEKYRNILDSIEEGYYEVDMAGRFTFINESLCRIIGYTKYELMDTNIRHYTDTQTAKRGYQAFNKVFNTGVSIKNFDWEIIREDGSRRHVEASVSLLKDVECQVIGFHGIVRDITERMQTEEALRREKEKFQVLVEESPFGVSIIEKNGNYKYLNPKFIKMFGYTLEDIPTGRAWFKKMYPDEGYRNQVISTWIDDLKESKAGESRPRVFNVKCKDGSDKVIQFRPVTTENGDQFIIYEDITEKKKLEAQFQAAQRVEALGTLAGGIAHDFNNLLMAIQGNVSLMLLQTEHTHPQYERVKNIEKQVQSGAKLTRQFLGYARKGKYEVKPLNLNQMVEETSDTFGRTRKEITIHRDLAEDLSNIEADQGQIEQVLLNLYVNAADAISGGGEIILNTKNVTHNQMKGKGYDPKPGNYVLFTITDTGIGMDKETQRRIFDPFFTTKEMGRGTGLGLASVYGIVKGHDGYIDVESEKGHGTVFSIYLPASEKNLKKVIGTSKELTEGNGTILLVDDEAMVLDVNVNMLEQLGYTVFKAAGGREAVAIYETNKDKVDLVILDIIMPDMDGGEVYSRMKGINSRVKVLLSSGYSIDVQGSEKLKRGCDGFIQKPFSLEEMSQKVREVLEKK